MNGYLTARQVLIRHTTHAQLPLTLHTTFVFDAHSPNQSSPRGSLTHSARRKSPTKPSSTNRSQASRIQVDPQALKGWCTALSNLESALLSRERPSSLSFLQASTSHPFSLRDLNRSFDNASWLLLYLRTSYQLSRAGIRSAPLRIRRR